MSFDGLFNNETKRSAGLFVLTIVAFSIVYFFSTQPERAREAKQKTAQIEFFEYIKMSLRKNNIEAVVDEERKIVSFPNIRFAPHQAELMETERKTFDFASQIIASAVLCQSTLQREVKLSALPPPEFDCTRPTEALSCPATEESTVLEEVNIRAHDEPQSFRSLRAGGGLALQDARSWHLLKRFQHCNVELEKLRNSKGNPLLTVVTRKQAEGDVVSKLPPPSGVEIRFKFGR